MPSVSVADLPDPAELAPRFARREPFRHLVIDDFLPAEYVAELLAQFPAFERGNARNEAGEVGGKSVVERIRELGPAFEALDDLVQSRAFLDWLSAATGIPDLRYDPWYFGGGTHENRHGQELDAHVDFNRHPEDRSHRRLNLIVYLNPEWEDAWGGSLELHTDPRADDDRITLVTPLYNRCVVFETTEWSWHGFSRIALPDDRRHLSRKSIALYFYTRERPPEELAPTHSTIYVDRPLPAHLHAGHVLTEADMAELRTLLVRRDMHNQRLYEELQQLQSLYADGGARSAGHAYRLVSGLRRIYRHRFVDRQALDAAAIKAAMLPFVANLPAAVREPLRRGWRRMLDRRRRPALHKPRWGLQSVHPSFDEGATPPQTIGRIGTTHHGAFAVADYALVYFPDTDALRLDPVPSADDLHTLYQASEQFSDAHYSSPEQVERILTYYGNCLEVFDLLPAPGQACLEVGAGLAWVSRACKQRDPGIRTVAQDVSAECVDRCPWVDDYRIGLLDAVPSRQRFALISMTHVIEHLTDPAAVLEDLASRLAPDGKLFVTAPYRPKDWTPEQGIQPWQEYSYLHVPAHISYLSKIWFERIADRTGLHLLRWDANQDEGRAFEAILCRPVASDAGIQGRT